MFRIFNGWILVLLIVSGCASGRRVADPYIPRAPDAKTAMTLYRLFEVDCQSDTCGRDGRTFPVTAFSHTQFPEPRTVLRESRHNRRRVFWGLMGTSIGGFAVGGLAMMLTNLMGSDRGGRGDVQLRQDGTLGSGIVLGVSTILAITAGVINATWDEPEEDFQDAYNRALAEHTGAFMHRLDAGFAPSAAQEACVRHIATGRARARDGQRVECFEAAP